MPKLSDRAMAERRRRIAEAAYRYFVREGYAAASVDGVCAEAGVSKGAFYVHFRSKNDLVRAVADLRGEGIPSLTGDTPAALATSLFAVLVVEMLDPATSRFEVEGLIYNADDAVLAARVAANLAAIRERIAEGLTHVAAAQGRRLAMPATAAADIVESFCLGLILRTAIWDTTPPAAARDAIEHLIASFLQ